MLTRSYDVMDHVSTSNNYRAIWIVKIEMLVSNDSRSFGNTMTHGIADLIPYKIRITILTINIALSFFSRWFCTKVFLVNYVFQ